MGSAIGFGAAHALAADALSSRFELIMVEEPGCGYCLAWHRQVGPGYGKSSEGSRAPLRTVDIRSPAAKALGRIVYTPTFVLVARGGGEVGRIVGYPGEELFWGQITRLVAKAEREWPEDSGQRAGLSPRASAAGSEGEQPR